MNKQRRPPYTRQSIRLLVSGLLGILLLAGADSRVRANGYPGAALFTFQCGSGVITFFYQNNPILQANLGQVSAAIGAARASGQNQLIVSGEPASVWALTSNEIQIHLNENPDGTKLVISANACGTLAPAGGAPAPASSNPTYYGSAVAYAEVTGTGRAFAYAQVTPYGSYAYAGAVGTGQVAAGAQTSGSGGSGPSGQKTYVVQQGDTLFRIAVRFGTSVGVLVSINRLSNPNMIQVGQVIYLP